MFKTIPQLLVSANMAKPLPGEISGRCYLCMENADDLIDIKKIVSGNFTGFQYLKAGDGLCKYCAGAFKEPAVRRSNWIVFPDSFETFKFNELRQKLQLALGKKQPFAIFVTKSFKKHGWIVNPFAINAPAKDGSFKRLTIIFEEDLAVFTERSLQEILELTEKLIPVLGKRRLETLDINSSVLEVLIELDLLKYYNRARRFVGNPAWEVIVKCTESPKKLITTKTLEADKKAQARAEKPRKKSKQEKSENDSYGISYFAS